MFCMYGQVSQEQGVIMTALIKMNCPLSVILIMFVTGSCADLEQAQQNHGHYEPPVDGGFVSPSKEYGDLFQEEQYNEKPELPHVAPIDDVYTQLDGSVYEKYNIYEQDDIEKQDDQAIAPILSVIVPSVVIGLVKFMIMKKD